MNILVCGTHYGSTYVRALTHFPQEQFKLKGILSRGSERSLTMAQQLSVPHFSTVSELPSGEFNIACVAVSGEAGKKLVMDLLSKGIAVLAEHPLDPEFIAEAFNQAKQHNTLFQVNGHFADLHAPQAFLQSLVSAHQQGYPCMHYDLAVNLRTLYSALDLLGRAMGHLNNFQIIESTVSDSQGRAVPFAPVLLKTEHATISLLCQNFASAEDDGSATFLNHRFSALFPHGTLLLSETTGPLSWFPTHQGISNEHWRTYVPVELPPLDTQQLLHMRDHANLGAIAVLASSMQGNPSPVYQSQEYLLALSTLWEALLKVLQPATA